MADSVKEKILSNLESTLAALEYINVVYRGKSRSLDLNNLPAVLIYELSDTEEDRETGGMVSREILVFVEFWAEVDTFSPALDLDSTLTNLEAEIQKAVMADYYQGGYARYTQLADIRRLMLEDDDTTGGGILSFTICYEAQENNPF